MTPTSTTPGVAITASSGDSGYGVSWPASLQYVTGVGGTTLSTASNARGWTESAWSGRGAADAPPMSYPYSHTSSLFGVTSGSNGSCGGSYLCTAGAGYDGPTGLGTPNGTGAF
jgi:subtilase family serine protease